MPTDRPLRRALLSVWDKSGLLPLAQALAARGVELVSTGGTLQALTAAGLSVTPVSALTGFPEILDGRVKTLHPRVHAGLLADLDRGSHAEELSRQGIEPFDLVVVNLYPFATTRARGAGEAERIEMIDIGGPAMVRAAAKNFAHLAVVVDPADYPRLLAVLAESAVVPLALRRELAGKAFAATAAYDREVAASFADRWPGERDGLPERIEIALERQLLTRYGENPHQRGAVYALGEGVLGSFRQLQGKELSWNNLLDADAARRLVALFPEPACVIVKHNNPCGVGRGEDLAMAYRRALACDPVSAFGSVIACNRPLDQAAAAAVAELFVELLIAPGFDDAALAALAGRKNLRLLVAPNYRPAPGALELRSIDGGFLAQEVDAEDDDANGWSCPTRRQPSAEEREALVFAWRVARAVKSNAIVLANRHQTVGIGAGQMSRVDSCRLAIEKAQLPVAGSVAASDAFFPFRDGPDLLAAAGVSALAQPGGSVRDAEVVAAADEHGLAMLLTARRHFRH